MSRYRAVDHRGCHRRDWKCGECPTGPPFGAIATPGHEDRWCPCTATPLRRRWGTVRTTARHFDSRQGHTAPISPSRPRPTATPLRAGPTTTGGSAGPECDVCDDIIQQLFAIGIAMRITFRHCNDLPVVAARIVDHMKDLQRMSKSSAAPRRSQVPSQRSQSRAEGPTAARLAGKSSGQSTGLGPRPPTPRPSTQTIRNRTSRKDLLWCPA